MASKPLSIRQLAVRYPEAPVYAARGQIFVMMDSVDPMVLNGEDKYDLIYNALREVWSAYMGRTPPPEADKRWSDMSDVWAFIAELSP